MKINKESHALLQEVMGRLNNFIENPWLTQMDPYQVVPNVYYIGNKYVGSYLLNTDRGLILIDVTMQETAYLLFESIRKLGFNPAKIKKVLISHGHIDHCGAARLVQEYSGCDIYFPIGDTFFLTERRDLILREDRVPEFKVTNYYDYSDSGVINFGNIRIKPVHTPGHTPGCTSFLLSVNCGKENLLLGMHGGLGLNGLSLAELEENRLPLSLQEDYLHSLEKIAKEPVDIVIPSHASHYPGDYFAIAAQNDGTGKVLRIPGAWEKLINDRIAQIKEVIARDHAQ